MSNFVRSTHVKKTRRERPCCWCGEQIATGSEAWLTCGSRDGEFWSWHLHTECHAAHQRCSNGELDELQDGWEFGEFRRGMTPGEAAAEKRGGP